MDWSSGVNDLGSRGLLGTRDDIRNAQGSFAEAAAIEATTGAGAVGIAVVLGPAAVALQVAKLPVFAAIMDGVVQYEVSPTRRLETPSGDELTDILGPGKGDVYWGEGWTLGLQTKYRLGIEGIDDNSDGAADRWVPDTRTIETYDILERTNQYVYTARDIENIIADLDTTIAQTADGAEKDKLQQARDTWNSLLAKNLAYQWQENYLAQGKSFEEFQAEQQLPGESQTLIFSAGPPFEYSRQIVESNLRTWSMSGGVETSAAISAEIVQEFTIIIGLPKTEFGGGAELDVDTNQALEGAYESGHETEQSVGFVLQDDDIGDSISTRIYADPVWGTPLFFQDGGSVTSDPWEPETNQAVDVEMALVAQPSNTAPFDYHEGAHYQISIQYAGQRELESSGINFLVYAPPVNNPEGVTIRFNGDDGPLVAELSKSAPVTNITVSVYPPAIDVDSPGEKQYSVNVQVEEEADSQISRALTLTPIFADLRAPRAAIAAPYDGQRISPTLFADSDFKVEAIASDRDLAKIQLQIRAKQPDGVWEPWRDLSGMLWEDGGANANVTVFDRTDREPIRREFTFDWTSGEIQSLGVGVYQLRAVAADKATTPNVDLDPPIATFSIDSSPPSVLTTVPFYQDKESQRTYRGELSVTFTDDMRSDDFSDSTFEVRDLLDGAKKVAGFVSYSPALRQAVFVPVTPFRPNGFYRTVIKTDTQNADGTIERGVRDLAGNPIDNEFTWTFRTTDAPFEETWSIALSATDGLSTDGNNIAAVTFGAEDGEDEKDARAVPALTDQLQLSFLSRDMVEFDRDTRPADGRLSHHWFFTVKNPSGAVTLRWQPTAKLTRSRDLRQYKDLRLVEFIDDGSGNLTQSNIISLEPSDARDATGLPTEVDIYSYTPANGELVRYFRLDVQKANFVATTLEKGTSGWIFFAPPITPEQADPFVNLGDDIDPLQLYQYDTAVNGYKVYPLDIGEVALQTGHGYFTRLESDVEVDIGGTSNNTDMTLTLEAAGWHPIGSPFGLAMNVADLRLDDGSGPQIFDSAVTSNWIEGTLYRWKVDATNGDSYEIVDSAGQLQPWEGYWLKTNEPNLVLTIPAPDLSSFTPTLPPSFTPPVSAAPPVARANESVSGFKLRLALTSAGSADLTTALGIRSDAEDGWDTFDASEPPRLSKTVSLYFDHEDRAGAPGRLNTDYRSELKVGESQVWRAIAVTEGPRTQMLLSWEDSIADLPNDIVLDFRRVDTDDEWQDMRQVRSVELESRSLMTQVTFEIRATRIALESVSGLSVVAGEAEVQLQWSASDNPHISDYIIYRDAQAIGTVSRSEYSFTDTNVEEELAYTYQVGVRFETGVELKSEVFRVKVLPLIRQTVLLHNYPNPFNPETWIPYELAEAADVAIDIYSVNGQRVRRLDIGFQNRGRYTSREKAGHWDGRNDVGERAGSGMYMLVFRAGDFTTTRKLVILK